MKKNKIKPILKGYEKVREEVKKDKMVQLLVGFLGNRADLVDYVIKLTYNQIKQRKVK